MKKLILTLLAFLTAFVGAKAQFAWRAGTPLRVSVGACRHPMIRTTIGILSSDAYHVFGDSVRTVRDESEADVRIYTLGSDDVPPGIDLKGVSGRREAFVLSVGKDNRLTIVGSDPHGTAYGIIQLTRLMGVSPWEWWADATPQRRTELTLPVGYTDTQAPGVDFRGIFINDEDWGLAVWNLHSYEPGYRKKTIGPDKNERIFELLLRLRANTYWPAMHECSTPFFLAQGNREVAERYGIYIGTSHCEPMACNAAGEWERRGKGAYNYVSNRDEVKRFWEDRVRSVAGQEIVYTLGMRGLHDGAMQGAKTTDERRELLTRIIADQRDMLARHVNEDVRRVPQVFIPYKEVLDIYNSGLEVPEDVTLIWPDDNFGYITHFPTAAERRRSGGSGVYYHVSYWGAPHDHLWLCTQSPALMMQQMGCAWDGDARRIWVLNVGDIKPCEYQTELFMDMAWDINSVRRQGPEGHLRSFLAREFGCEAADALLPHMMEHYRLSFIHKPEFMGGSRVYQNGHDMIADLPWSETYLRTRMEEYMKVSDAVEEAWKNLPSDKLQPYFHLVKYPVQAAAQMNRKLILGQLARHGKADWHDSDLAFDSIAHLTNTYNTGVDGRQKWYRMMDFQPRQLPVFGLVPHVEATQPMAVEVSPLYVWNAADCHRGKPVRQPSLGYNGGAALYPVGQKQSFVFDASDADSLTVELSFVPTFPLDTQLRVNVSLDGCEQQTVRYDTAWHTEQWKQGVLFNRTTCRLCLPVKGARHTLTITASDRGVVVDDIRILR